MDHKKQDIINIMMEESAEVIQAISKINRFGLTSVSPYPDHEGKTNFELLKEEVGDLLTMIHLFNEFFDVSEQEIDDRINRKISKLERFSTIFQEDEL